MLQYRLNILRIQAGHFSEALELAFESQQYAALELISQELDDRTDPVLLERCADFFTEHGQFDRAVAMLVAAKRVSRSKTLLILNKPENSGRETIYLGVWRVQKPRSNLH